MIEPKIILNNATSAIYGDRHETHGSFRECFDLQAKLISAYLGVEVTPVDVCMIMDLVKTARIKSGKPIKDHFVDKAGYSALAAGVIDEDE